VLTQECESARSADIGDTTTCTRLDANGAASTGVGVRHIEEIACTVAHF
jgi:hypothetical protein